MGIHLRHSLSYIICWPRPVGTGGTRGGGVIACLFAAPRLVELALFRRAVPAAEASCDWQEWRCRACGRTCRDLIARRAMDPGTELTVPGGARGVLGWDGDVGARLITFDGGSREVRGWARQVQTTAPTSSLASRARAAFEPRATTP